MLLHLSFHVSGPECTGAVLVSLSATKGATIFRVKRDDKVRIDVQIQIFGVHYMRTTEHCT